MVASARMELGIHIQVEKLPEGQFLATSDELEGLVAQGRTVAEARDVAEKADRSPPRTPGPAQLPSRQLIGDLSIHRIRRQIDLAGPGNRSAIDEDLAEELHIP